MNFFCTITEWVIWYHFGIGMKKQSLQTSLKKKHSKREPIDVVKKLKQKTIRNQYLEYMKGIIFAYIKLLHSINCLSA